MPAGRPALPVALVVAAAALAVRFLATAVLVRRVYPDSGVATALWSVPYELLAVPRGLFAPSLVWRGARYEIGRRGEIRSVSRSR